MTTLRRVKVRCALCGAKNELTRVGSTNTLTWPDLDGRPAPMARDTLGSCVEQCARCGFCAEDLSKAPPGARERAASKAYQDAVNDVRLPPLARRFAGLSLLQDGWGVFWASLRAAWACDDAKATAEAARWRSKAFDALEERRRAGERLEAEPGMERTIRADLLRRMGRFGEVGAEVDAGLAETPSDTVRKSLELERSLAAKGDAGCRTVGEALGEPAPWWMSPPV